MKTSISITKNYIVSFSKKNSKCCLDSCAWLSHDEHCCVAFGILLDFKKINQFKYDGELYAHLRCNNCLLATQKGIK